MMLFRIIAFSLLTLLQLTTIAQTITTLATTDSISIRGLSVVNDKVIWASGNKGFVMQSVDGGRSWDKTTVARFEERDFRDIAAFNDTAAVIMAVAEPAIILKTTNSGKTWKLVFSDTTPGMFLDAMSFDALGNGVVVGDPIAGKAFVLKTSDFGNHWEKLSYPPALQKGEAFFAASGTNVSLNQRNIFFVTGGTTSRFYNGSFKTLPLKQGTETAGANSLAVFDSMTLAVVGGDFSHPADTVGNCTLSFDGGKTWQAPKKSPSGYRSCVIYLSADTLFSCGINGVDISTDKGLHWKQISTQGFHVCQKSKTGKAVFLAGTNGRIAKLEF